MDKRHEHALMSCDSATVQRDTETAGIACRPLNSVSDGAVHERFNLTYFRFWRMADDPQ